MSVKVWQSIFPLKEQQWLKAGPNPALQQCLQQLGYLSQANSDFKKALRAFRKAAIVEKLLPASILRSRRSGELSENHLAQKLLALEGDFSLARLPQLGSNGLAVRLLHYRLHLLGLYHKPLHLDFSSDSMAALDQLGEWLQLAADSPQLLGLTGHLNALLHRVRKKGQLSKHIVAFQFSPDLLATDLQKEVREESRVTESSEDLEKLARKNDRDLAKWENKILGKERAESQRLSQRNANKQKRLDRLKRLQKQVLLQLRRLLLEHLKRQKLQKKKLVEWTKKAAVLAEIIEEMKSTLAQVDDKQKRRQLRAQIRGRKKQLKQQERTWDRRQKKWAKQELKQAAVLAKKQSQLKEQQEQLKLLRAQINGLRFRFKAQLKRSLDSETYRLVTKKVFRQKDQSYLDELSQEPYNLFLLRLLQLHQWSNAYYTGKIDGVFTTKTFGAIAEMVEDIPRLRLKYILTSLRGAQKGYWVLNIDYLLRRFCQLQSLRAAPPDRQKILERYQKALENQQWLYRTEETEQCWQEWQKDQGSMTYQGRENLWRSFGRVIVRLGKVIGKGLKIVGQVVRNFIRLLYEDIRESVILFSQSLDFLFGKRRRVPLGGGETWDIPPYEYDPSLGVAENAEAAELHLVKEAPKANLPAQSIEHTLAILAKLVKWTIALAMGSLTWPQVALQLLLFFRKWFLRWLKQLLLERRGELILSPPTLG